MESARPYFETFRFLWSRRSAGEFEALESTSSGKDDADTNRPGETHCENCWGKNPALRTSKARNIEMVKRQNQVVTLNKLTSKTKAELTELTSI